MGLFVHAGIMIFATVVVILVLLFVVVDMLSRVDYLQSNIPWLNQVLQRRLVMAVLLLVAIFLLIGDSYELLTREIPGVPEPPVVRLVSPVPPAMTIIEKAPPIQAQCWVKNYAAPVFSPPTWGIATIFCNTTIKPPYSVELDYDQTVALGPLTFPVGSEFAKSMETNEGTKTIVMVDLHTIIPNEPFSIMSRGNDRFPLVKKVAIRAKGLVFEFHP